MRATGRTTRMIEDAKARARGGRAVYVVAANEAQRRQLEIAAGEEARALGVKFETPERLGNFDWNSMGLIGAHPNCLVLVDHFAIESRFSKILEMLHRYDLERPNAVLSGAADEHNQRHDASPRPPRTRG